MGHSEPVRARAIILKRWPLNPYQCRCFGAIQIPIYNGRYLWVFHSVRKGTDLTRYRSLAELYRPPVKLARRCHRQQPEDGGGDIQNVDPAALDDAVREKNP